MQKPKRKLEDRLRDYRTRGATPPEAGRSILKKLLTLKNYGDREGNRRDP